MSLKASHSTSAAAAAPPVAEAAQKVPMETQQLKDEQTSKSETQLVAELRDLTGAIAVMSADGKKQQDLVVKLAFAECVRTHWKEALCIVDQLLLTATNHDKPTLLTIRLSCASGATYLSADLPPVAKK